MDDTTPTTGEEQAAAAEQRTERAAAGCLLAIAIGVGGAVAVAVPETAYYAAGLGTAMALRKTRSWIAGRREHADEQLEEADPVDIVAVLLSLSQGQENVRLTQLQEAAGLPDTKAVRALLDEAGIPIRPGVRAGGKNGPGIHRDDIPREEAPPSGRCLCRSHANTNANNTSEEGTEKGLRVDPIGQAGAVIHTPAEANRHHTISR
ncbi:hypothetical protein [Streptomyces sp. NPDC058872]|uniref:hypothetical protein n=1 Tax=Streptomyces sp. NPDC058872 TaxID=3346661 RepID=UPI0036A13AE1